MGQDGDIARRISFGRAVIRIRCHGDRFTALIDLRTLAVSFVILIMVLGLAALSLMSGTYAVSFTQMFDAIAGRGDAVVRMVVLEWRAPRIVFALLLGGALGLSGAIFQSLTRNPLGSPDIIGFSSGSYTGALVAILLHSGGYYETAAASLVGGILTASAVYMLAYRRGVQGFRLIIVGIGVSAILGAHNAWMIRQAGLQVAMGAAMWGAGSLNGLGMEQLWPAFILLSAIAPVMLLLSRSMRQLELGDDAAKASGVIVERSRLSLMLVGVALTAIVTAAAGPISFIALCAPQIARRLTRSAHASLLSAALTGSLLLVSADWAAQHAFGVQLPVGVMTVSVGGIYFIWLLIREGRK